MVPALEEAPPEERAVRSLGADAAADADTPPLLVFRASLPDASSPVDSAGPLLGPLLRFLVILTSGSVEASWADSFGISIQSVLRPSVPLYLRLWPHTGY